MKVNGPADIFRHELSKPHPQLNNLVQCLDVGFLMTLRPCGNIKGGMAWPSWLKTYRSNAYDGNLVWIIVGTSARLAQSHLSLLIASMYLLAVI